MHRDEHRYDWNDRRQRDPDDDTARRFVEAIVVLLSITGAVTMLGWWLS